MPDRAQVAAWSPGDFSLKIRTERPGSGQPPLLDAPAELLDPALTGWIIGPVAEELAPQAGAGGGEVITPQLQQRAGIVGPLLQTGQQPAALIETILLEAHQQIAGLAIEARHLTQRLGR